MEALIIKLWADLGGSTLKILVELPTESTAPLMMPSRVIQLDDWLASNCRVEMLQVSPQADAMVRLGRCYYAVGQLAEQYATDATSAVEIKQPKQNSAIPKLLAVVGIIQQQYQLPRKFAIELTLLLPFPEYQFVKDGRNSFRTDLKKSLANFEFRREKFQVALASFSCKPEGSGLIMLRYQQQHHREHWLSHHKIAALMLGHRNTSVLLYDRGTPSGYTNHLGFHHLIQTVIDSSLGQSAAALTQAIYKADDLTPDHPQIQALALTEGKSQRTELVRLVEAIDSARNHRWQQIATWVKPLLDNVDELIIGGGTALFYQKAIASTFNSTPLFWAVATKNEPVPSIPHPPTSPVGNREDLAQKLLAAKPGADALKAKTALEQYEQQLHQYHQQQAQYEQQFQQVKAALECEQADHNQLRRSSAAMLEEIAQTLFRQEVSSFSDEQRFQLTQLVDIYGVWKAIKYGQ
jgi:hypothetical protein